MAGSQAEHTLSLGRSRQTILLSGCAVCVPGFAPAPVPSGSGLGPCSWGCDSLALFCFAAPWWPVASGTFPCACFPSAHPP